MKTRTFFLFLALIIAFALASACATVHNAKPMAKSNGENKAIGPVVVTANATKISPIDEGAPSKKSICVVAEVMEEKTEMDFEELANRVDSIRLAQQATEGQGWQCDNGDDPLGSYWVFDPSTCEDVREKIETISAALVYYTQLVSGKKLAKRQERIDAASVRLYELLGLAKKLCHDKQQGTANNAE